MIRFYFLLLVFFCQFSFQASAEEVIVVKAESGDATPRLQAAIEKARTMKGKKVEIRLEQGDYHLYHSSASKQRYFVSNTTSEKEDPDPTKHIALWMKDLKNMTFNGQGAHLITHGEITTFVIDQCENVKLCNFSLKAADPSVVEMTVMDTTAYTATFKVHPTSHYRIKDNQIEWYGEEWSFRGGIAQTFDWITNITNRCSMPTENAVSIKEAGTREISIRYNKPTSVRPGEVFQMRDAIRDEVCGFIHRSKNVELERLNLHFLGNFGIVGQYSENLTYKQLVCAPEYGSGRTCAGFADFIQVSGCKGKVRIQDSRFEGAHDDPINIHGTHLKVIQYEADNQVQVRFMHDQSYGFEAFFPGDRIEITDVHSLKCLHANVIRSVERINDYEIKLILKAPVPKAIQEVETVVENITWTPEVEIANNYFARTPTRGILITTRQKVCIEQNIFYRTPMSAISICNDARSWYESGPVHDVTIRDNEFIECGSPVINISPENDRPDRAVHKNISILNNRFLLKNPIAIYARWVENIKIHGNHFESLSKSESSPIQLENCSTPF